MTRVMIPAASANELEQGCSSTGGSTSAWMALSLLGLLALRRRKGSAATTLGSAMMVCLAASSASAHAPGTGMEITHEHLDVPHAAMPLPELESGALGTRTELFRRANGGAILQPVISADGKRLLFSTVEMRELFLVERGRAPRKLIEQKGAGWMPSFRDDGTRVLVRPSGIPHAGQPMIELDTKGTFIGPRDEVFGLSVREEDGRIFLRTGAKELQLSSDEEDDTFFAPVLSPDGHHVVFSGIRTGMFLFRVRDGHLFWLGHNANPRFSPRGDAIVFERTSDEGLILTGSDLYFVDLNRDLVIERLTHSEELERMPSLTEDLRVVFTVDDVVYIAERVSKR